MYKIILQVFATLCKRSLILLTSGMGGDGWAGKGTTQGERKEMITLHTSLPADVLWGSFVRNECVTNEPQRTSAGRLPPYKGR